MAAGGLGTLAPVALWLLKYSWDRYVLYDAQATSAERLLDEVRGFRGRPEAFTRLEYASFAVKLQVVYDETNRKWADMYQVHSAKAQAALRAVRQSAKGPLEQLGVPSEVLSLLDED